MAGRAACRRGQPRGCGLPPAPHRTRFGLFHGYNQVLDQVLVDDRDAQGRTAQMRPLPGMVVTQAVGVAQDATQAGIVDPLVIQGIDVARGRPAAQAA